MFLGAVHGACGELARALLIERARAARAGPPELRQVVDHLLPVGPVGLSDGAEGCARLVGHRREIGVGAGGARRDQSQRRDATRMVQCDHLGHRAPRRLAHHVRAAHAERVEHADRVRAEVLGRVPGRAGWIADRLPGVAVVVADDVPRPGRQARAEVVLPPVHRGARPHDEQDRRVGRAAEGLDAEIDAVDLHQSISRRCRKTIARRHITSPKLMRTARWPTSAQPCQPKDASRTSWTQW